MTHLLQFHKQVLQRIHDPSTNDFLLLARGLGLQRIVCNLLKIYDSPQNLVVLINASSDEETTIGTELGLLGCRNPGLRIVGYEIGRRERQELYKKGGLMSITSRILVVDMLQSDMPTDMITGIVVLHAEKVTSLSLEAFIVRLYREKNRHGFLKAFSDQPESITSGLSPLKATMKELQLRNVHIYPRFHRDIKDCLEQRKVEVIELYQHLTDDMSEIHAAIMHCMNMTLSELKRSNSMLDLDEFTVENAYFRSFDLLVRRQLDSVWHKVSSKIKQLIDDLATLRRLLSYLLTYDAVSFYAYLETLITSNSVGLHQHKPPWLLTDHANTIFQLAKRRCYELAPTVAENVSIADPFPSDEPSASLNDANLRERQKILAGVTRSQPKASWLPDGMYPVLEELPKWSLVAAVLDEIEEEIVLRGCSTTPATLSTGSHTVLIMTSSLRSSLLIKEFLSTMDPTAPSGIKGRKMMGNRLLRYVSKKATFGNKGNANSALSDNLDTVKNGHNVVDLTEKESEGLSEALKRKDEEQAHRVASRRRVRGRILSALSSAGDRSTLRSTKETFVNYEDGKEPGVVVDDLIVNAESYDNAYLAYLPIEEICLDPASQAFEDEFNHHYGLLVPNQTTLIRSYSHDSDDQMLSEIMPTFIIMVEPNEDFIRRIETYRASNPGLSVRVYHMLYKNSYEEHMLLASMRREKDSFERLIKERASMLLPIMDDKTSVFKDSITRPMSSRIAGGRVELNQDQKVIVDMREFRSTLPSLLHAATLLVIPATLAVGDYILTPDICVERKSISDLISSLNTGRLYSQCELMSVHYKQPILLIEFEEHRPFSLENVAETNPHLKPTAKTKSSRAGEFERPQTSSIQSKLVLLTLAFPRVRILWSSSPYATVEVFSDLKKNSPEPDVHKAVGIGAEDDAEAGIGINQTAEELLQCLPGVTAKNVKYVMKKAGSVKHLCEMEQHQVQEILGVGPGKECWDFIHHGPSS